MIKYVLPIESRAYEGDITGTPDCVIVTNSESSTIGAGEDMAIVEQKASIQDFAENEYQAQLDASSQEIEASSS